MPDPNAALIRALNDHARVLKNHTRAVEQANRIEEQKIRDRRALSGGFTAVKPELTPDEVQDALEEADK